MRHSASIYYKLTVTEGLFRKNYRKFVCMEVKMYYLCYMNVGFSHISLT